MSSVYQLHRELSSPGQGENGNNMETGAGWEGGGCHIQAQCRLSAEERQVSSFNGTSGIS